MCFNNSFNDFGFMCSSLTCSFLFGIDIILLLYIIIVFKTFFLFIVDNDLSRGNNTRHQKSLEYILLKRNLPRVTDVAIEDKVLYKEEVTAGDVLFVNSRLFDDWGVLLIASAVNIRMYFYHVAIVLHHVYIYYHYIINIFYVEQCYHSLSHMNNVSIFNLKEKALLLLYDR